MLNNVVYKTGSFRTNERKIPYSVYFKMSVVTISKSWIVFIVYRLNSPMEYIWLGFSNRECITGHFSTYSLKSNLLMYSKDLSGISCYGTQLSCLTTSIHFVALSSFILYFSIKRFTLTSIFHWSRTVAEKLRFCSTSRTVTPATSYLFDHWLMVGARHVKVWWWWMIISSRSNRCMQVDVLR